MLHVTHYLQDSKTCQDELVFPSTPVVVAVVLLVVVCHQVHFWPMAPLQISELAGSLSELEITESIHRGCLRAAGLDVLGTQPTFLSSPSLQPRWFPRPTFPDISDSWWPPGKESGGAKPQEEEGPAEKPLKQLAKRKGRKPCA